MYQVKGFTYQNGLRLLVAERSGSAEASVDLKLPYGLAHCPREKRQAAHFAEHMLFRSTPQRRWVDRVRDLDRMAVELDAGTKTDRTSISFTVPQKYLRPTMHILLDLFQNTDFAEDEFEMERETLEGEMNRRQNDPEVYGDDMLFQVAFGDHPLGQENYDSVRALTRRDIVEAKSKHYCPDNLVIAVAGAVPTETEDVIGETFGSLPKTGLQKPRFTRPNQEHGLFREERDTNSGFLSRGWVVPGLESIDDLFAFYFIEHLLSGSRDLYQFSSRIYYRLITQEGLGYTARADYSAFLGCGVFRVELVGTSQKNTEAAKKSIDEEIGKLKEEPVPEEEFEVARKTLKIGESRDSHNSDGSFSQTLSLNALKGLPLDPESFEEQVDKLTPAKITEAARRYFTAQHATVEIVGTGNSS